MENTFERIRKHYIDAQKNKFWDAWGIVLHTDTLYNLIAEIPQVTVSDAGDHLVHTLFGLTVIEANKWLDMMEQECVVVDKPMGELIMRWESAHKAGVMT